MAIIRFPCPQCQRVLKVGDQFSGRQSKCPGCQSPVTVPAESDPSIPEAPTAVASAAPRRPAAAPTPRAPAAPSQNFDFDDDAAPPPPQESWEYEDANDAVAVDAAVRASAGAWKAVRTGVRLLQIGVYVKIGAIVILLGALILMFLTGAAYMGYLTERMNSSPGYRGSSASSGAAEAGMAMLFLFLALMALVVLAMSAAEILNLIGAIMFLQVPEPSGAKGFGIGVLIAQIVLMASPFLSCAGTMAQVGAADNLAGLLQFAAGITWIVMLLLFIHKIGSYLRSEALCKEVVHFAIWIGICVGVYIGAICLWFFVVFAMFATVAASSSRGNRSSDLLANAGMGAAVVMGLIALILLGMFIALLVKYIQLLTTTQDVITRRAIRANA